MINHPVIESIHATFLNTYLDNQTQHVKIKINKKNKHGRIIMKIIFTPDNINSHKN